MKKRNSLDNFVKEIYMGVDESNHGRYPEIFVAAFSSLKKDINPLKFKKIRNPSLGFFGNFSQRDYAFLFMEENDFNRISKEEVLGIIISSLLYDKNVLHESKLKILIDGAITPTQKQTARELIPKYVNLNKENISIDSGPGFDQKYKIVNLADAMANYLFRNSSSEKSSKNKHRRFLLK